jgi:hypothetical protein
VADFLVVDSSWDMTIKSGGVVNRKERDTVVYKVEIHLCLPFFGQRVASRSLRHTSH